MPRDIVRGPIGSLSGPVSFDSTQIILGNIGYYDDTVTKEWLEENIAEQTEWLLKKQGSHSFITESSICIFWLFRHPLSHKFPPRSV